LAAAGALPAARVAAQSVKSDFSDYVPIGASKAGHARTTESGSLAETSTAALRAANR